jgi:hypothetical protein
MPESRLAKRIHNATWGRPGGWAEETEALLQRYRLEMPPSTEMSSKAWEKKMRRHIGAVEGWVWEAEAASKPKLRTLTRVKQQLAEEEYIQSTGRDAVVLARLRTGSSELEIERGRWRGLKLDERLCPLCGSGVGDEEHILCRCSRLEGVRRAHTAHLFEKLIDKGYDSTVRELAWGGAEEWLRVRLGCATGLEGDDTIMKWAGMSAKEIMQQRARIAREG